MALLICSEDKQPLRIDVSTMKASLYISIIVHEQVNEDYMLWYLSILAMEEIHLLGYIK
jgi:hypothetical protein